MDLVPIGEAAARLGLSASALRYYDDRGLVRPAQRRAGRRMYGQDDLRRLAFIKIFHQLGVSLDTAAAVLDAPAHEWREIVREQISELEDVVTLARGAQQFLTNALKCPTEHPASECPTMTSALDRLVEGMTVAQLAREYDGPAPPSGA